ncbi:MAG: redoxin domain-containing protein [Deltaproteobacteria bacterium]|nr:redoxin domain-containing protein [Deltaproteobacteria bacterium]MBW2724555.1 redoxin domain-containing protein [Deltaproteobacteria bacterium]
MTQLVELQEALPKFEAAGLKLYAVSYDDPDALAEFARHHDITYPLLSDKGSKVIRSYGIQNQFVTKEQIPYYGIPFPGSYLVDEAGIVIEKFFSRGLAARESAESVIDSALGEILLGDDEPTDTGGDEEIRISATYHGGGGNLKSAVIRQLVVRFELAPGLHIYDDPVPPGMVATRIEVSGPPGLNTNDVVKLPTKNLKLPGVDTELHVWEGRVDFAIPVWADDRIAGLINESEFDEIDIEVKIDYQACDDQACRIPQSETLTVKVPIAPYLGHDLPGDLSGAVMTTMDTRKYMMRMVRRGLLRSPIKGFKYMKESMEHLRKGPARKRKRPTTPTTGDGDAPEAP